MPVLNLLSYTLEVPSLETGVRFYTDAGLEAAVDGHIARLRCAGQARDSGVLIGGAPPKPEAPRALRAPAGRWAPGAPATVRQAELVA